MVSEVEYIKNQEVFRTAGERLLAPGNAARGGQPFRPTEEESFANLASGTAQGAAVAGLAAIGAGALPVLGAGGAAAGGGGGGIGVLGSTSVPILGKLTLAKVGVLTLLSASISGTVSQNFGQNFNSWLSKLGIGSGELTRAAREFAYTTPIEDPETGDLFIADPDGKLVIEGLEKAGIAGPISDPNSPLAIRFAALTATRRQNEALMMAWNSGLIPRDFRRPGEDPFDTAKRFFVRQDTLETRAAEREQIKQEKLSEEQQQQDIATAQRAQQATGQPQALAQGQPQRSPSIKFTTAEGKKELRQVKVSNPETGEFFPASQQEGFRPGENFARDTPASLQAAQNLIRQQEEAQKQQRQTSARDALLKLRGITKTELPAPGVAIA